MNPKIPLDAKRDSKGRYFLDWTPRQSPWKVGKRNEPNKWITFYAYLAHKFKDNTRAGDNLMEMEIRLERLKRMRAAYTHAFSDTPEEDTRKRMIEWLKSKGLNEKSVKARLFGRNTYSTDKPEPHGYELYLTVHCDDETEGDIKAREIPEGLYAVLRFKNLNKIGEAWKKLWKWIKQSEYEHVGWKKGEHGWVDGFEEHLNWQEGKPQTEWIFDIWVQLKE